MYVLPSRLRRARHRHLNQTVYICSDCWEKPDASHLAISVDGSVLKISKTGQQMSEIFNCQICARPSSHRELYALISYTFIIGYTIIDSSIIESEVLALLCVECIESRKIVLHGF